MKTKEEVILFESDESATLKTVTGWVSRDGRFCGDDEGLARFIGCTHKTCDCGKIMSKSYTKCDSCRAEIKQKQFNEYPFQEWDGITPLAIFDSDEYFFDEDDIEQYLEDNELQPEGLRLVLCKPEYAKPICSDYWIDDLPEDGEIPDALQKKLDELNELIKGLDAISWFPAKIRTEYKRS